MAWADLTLTEQESVTIDYADTITVPEVDGELRLLGGTQLNLENCGAGDGKTYTLFTGVSELLDAQGNAITLDSSNNAISNYFDTTQPGTGFWGAGVLQLSPTGELQLVRHNETVKYAQEITERQENGADYRYYEGITCANIKTSANEGDAYGGAIYGGDNSIMMLSNNGSVTFSENEATGKNAYGGAIHGGTSSTITLSDNGSVTLTWNEAGSASTSYKTYARGGAIYGGDNSTITLSNNGSVTLSENTASHYNYATGAAIHGGNNSTITLSNNDSVRFSGNSASSGGAIYGGTFSSITLSDNVLVFFGENTGGAIRGGDVTLSGNGNVSFNGNTSGGAIRGDDVTLSDNVSVIFSKNSAYSLGGAIHTLGNLSICNNDSVLFEKNAEKSEENYKLRSVQAGGSGVVISLASAAGKSIEFRDSVYILSGSMVNLNADYGDMKQTGDIVITGKFTEEHLNSIMEADNAGRTARVGEILNSRTTLILAMTNLYGGRLRVEDAAIFRGYGITAAEDSNASVLVQNAVLEHGGYNLTFHSGTNLELIGSNTISGTVQMLAGSNLVLDVAAGKGSNDILGGLQFGEGCTFTLNQGNTSFDSNEVLLYVSEGVSGWESVQTELSDGSSLSWVENLLVYNYDEDSFNHYYNGTVDFASGQYGKIGLHHYDSLNFKEFSSSSGKAISGSKITLHNNGSVTFSSNTASSTGGAIAGSEGSTITMRDNESVAFRQNTVAPEGETSSNAYAQGGAIYAFGATLQFDNNGTLLFEGNTVRAEFVSENYIYAYLNGGAITGGDVTLDTNQTVTFSGNSVVSAQTTKQDVSESVEGGAISGNSIQLYNNETLQFLNNAASAEAKDSFNSIHSNALGGAISGKLTLKGNKNVLFSRNEATVINPNVSAYSIYITANGGAANSWSSTITDNGTVTFSQNKATAHIDYYGTEYYPDARGSVVAQGGALYGTEILLQNNKELNFSGNSVNMSVNCPGDYPISLETALSAGGAIYGETVKVQGNTAATFSANSAYAWAAPSYALGGGIYSTEVLIDANKSILFEENYADTAGGAIFGNTVTLKNNESIKFASNSAAYDGGAIYSAVSVHISDNDEVVFIDNFARGDGGAICNTYAAEPGVISLTNNGNVVFSGNYSNNIGAISTSGSLVIQNNDSVVFEKNLQQRPYDAYRLHSIQVYNGSPLTLSAPEEKSIEIRDSIMTTGNVIINADYIDSSGKAVKQTGDVVFSGACTKQHLDELLERFDEKRTARDLEIQASRTSETWATTHVYGGRLRVEDGVIYQGQGLIAHEGSGATVRVKDAVLNHAGYELEFNDSSILEIEGDCTIRGKVNLKADSMFRLQKAASLSLHETAEADAATLTVNGGAMLSGSSTLNASLTLTDGAMLDMDFLDAGAVTLNGALTFGGQVTMGDMLLSTLEEMHRKDEFVTLFTGVTHLELSDSPASESTGRLWVGDVFSNLAGDEHYYFNYEADAGSLSIVYIPEPTTATLSLLALAGLAARRRRK